MMAVYSFIHWFVHSFSYLKKKNVYKNALIFLWMTIWAMNKTGWKESISDDVRQEPQLVTSHHRVTASGPNTLPLPIMLTVSNKTNMIQPDSIPL